MQRFCESNGVQHVVRSHQLCMDGFQEVFENLLTTIWSAPNYCYRCGMSYYSHYAGNNDRALLSLQHARAHTHTLSLSALVHANCWQGMSLRSWRSLMGWP